MASKYLLNIAVGLMFLFITSLNANCQSIYAADYKSQAELSVYEVKNKSQADLLVYLVDYKSEAGENNGNWFFVEFQSQSDRSEEHTSELQSRPHLVCRLLLEKKKKTKLS